MNKLKYIFIIPLLLLSFASCSDYVTGVDPFIDRVTDDGLNGETYVDGLIVGLENQANWAIDDAMVNSDGLSDALIFDRRNANATYSGLENADWGLPQDTDSEFSGPFTNLHELRVQADTLLYRINNKITFTSTAIKNRGLFAANFWSGVACFYLGSYYGKTEAVGGSPLNRGRFYTTTEMYQKAIAKIKTAITTADATQSKVANSFLARIYLCMGDFANAATYANLGLKKGDAAQTLKYNTTNNNAFRSTAGDTRTQFSLDPRFKAYTVADASEKNRLKFNSYSGTGGFVYDSQRKYVLNTDGTVTPIELIDWLEVNLIRAELIIRGAASGDALALINEVRTQGGVTVKPAGTVISILPETGKYSIYEERDKALWLRGLRVLDQIRLNKWHLAAGTWKWFQIPYTEKQKNPNWSN